MAANVPNNNDPIDEEDEPEDVIEGGVAHQHHDGDGSATSADLHLFLVCVEDLEDLYPAHPVLRKDVSVQIGLDKSTKFQAVMQRYLDVCNEAFPEYPVRLQDLEFAHATVLKGNETPEMAALMKNDRVAVRKNRTRLRQQDDEQRRVQREMDVAFLEQYRALLSSGDVVLDCRGKVGSQGVLSPHVRCHSAMVRKRCPWLAQKIDMMLEPPNDVAVRGVPPQVNAIENDEDENVPTKPRAVDALAVVTLDHAPHAVKILLEYCYTNRVVELGYEAFRKASVSNNNYQEPVPPFARREWPGHGFPQVAFDVLMAAMHLAIEADMPRLALMCEVAASLGVSRHTATEALQSCQRVQAERGRELTFLRRAAMEEVIRNKLVLQPTFREALRGNSDLVPLLLQGTKEMVEPTLEKRHDSHDWQSIAFHGFRRHDRDDKAAREHERRKRRLERGIGVFDVDGDEEDSSSVDSLQLSRNKHRKSRESGGLDLGKRRRRGFSSREAAADLQREYIRTTQK